MLVRACVFGWMPGRVGVCVYARACSLAHSACKAHAPDGIVICVLSGSTILLHIIS